jgi:lipopolysaccharide/colanic/teichoic acid biosynthesis glycosyltransferase
MINNPSSEYLQSIALLSEEDYVEDGMTETGRDLKRCFDFCVALVCLIVFSPLFLICYIAVRREDGGPAIYKQERIGRYGKPFFIYKFRSMKLNAEQHGPQLTAHEDDNRLTRVGRFLRAHHLDELPQLYNVLVGDMAFIGPRPEREYYIKQIMKRDPRYQNLYQIRPGVTSYATLYNGYCDTLEKMLRRLELDLYYLEHRSWWFEMKILFMTFLNIVKGKKF